MDFLNISNNTSTPSAYRGGRVSGHALSRSLPSREKDYLDGVGADSHGLTLETPTVQPRKSPDS